MCGIVADKCVHKITRRASVQCIPGCARRCLLYIRNQYLQRHFTHYKKTLVMICGTCTASSSKKVPTTNAIQTRISAQHRGSYKHQPRRRRKVISKKTPVLITYKDGHTAYIPRQTVKTACSASTSQWHHAPLDTTIAPRTTPPA
jgi:hypothetical protein